jgi:hypothetical protein
VAVAAAFSGPFATHVAVTTEELCDLGLEGHLHEQANAQVSHLLHRNLE